MSKETAICDKCNCSRELLSITIKRSRIKNGGKYICASCKAKMTNKPQCSQSWWTEQRKESHGQAMRASEKYYAAIENRNTSGEKNSMYARKHTPSARQKMSESRKGKIGTNATAWKGGKLSLTRRVKGIIHTRYDWYRKVYQRDNYKCLECGSGKQIDAHHMKPVWKLIRELLINKHFETEDEKLEWLVNQPAIKDEHLQNGKTLCRTCHKKAHSKWGSHHVE